jgi:O-antigen/teichoic acid export membrane protein
METEEILQPRRSVALMQRAGWGVADQALSSLTNFALGVLIARSMGPAGLGSFTIVFATYTTALGISRAVSSEPLLVHYSAPSHAAWRGGTARATGAALLVGLGLGLCCMLIGWIAAGVLTKPFIVLGLTLPGLLLQDCWRYAFFARGRGFSAFANDLVWALVLFPVLFLLLRSNQDSVTWLALLGWGGAATLAALFGAYQSRVVPAPHRVLNWVRKEASLIPRFLSEFVVQGGTAQFTLYAIGAVTGLAALGSFRAAYLLFGPMQVLFMGLGAIAVPELVRALANSTTRLLWTSRLLSLALAGTSLVWGVVVLALPVSVGVALLGPAWQPARLLAVAVMTGWVATGLTAGAAAGLRALAAARQSLRARLVGSLFAVAGGIAGVVMGGVRGAAWGLALAGWIEAVVWWWQYTGALRERARVVSVEVGGPARLFSDPSVVSPESSP